MSSLWVVISTWLDAVGAVLLGRRRVECHGYRREQAMQWRGEGGVVLGFYCPYCGRRL